MRQWIGMLALCALVTASTACAETAAQAQSADARFKALYTSEWAWRKQQFPGTDYEDKASENDDRLPAVDAKSQAARLEYWDGVLRRLDTIPADQLSAENRINSRSIGRRSRTLPPTSASAGTRCRSTATRSSGRTWASWPASRCATRSRRALHLPPERHSALFRRADRQHARRPQARLFGAARGARRPRRFYRNRRRRADAARQRVLQAVPAAAVRRYRPRSRQTLRDDCTKAIREHVLPAYAKLLKFFRNEYMPHARTTLAAEALPDGKAYYRQQIREYTTLDLDPDAIHEIGLKEVARIDGEMQQTMRATGFTGDFPAFLKFLRTDPQFYAKTPEELLMRASWIAKQRRRQAVAVLRPAAARALRHRAGAGVDRAVLDRRPWRRAYLLGQHLRPAVAPAVQPAGADPARVRARACLPGRTGRGAEGVPDFRQQYISAYGEGWALYCEQLGKEMGIYRTPYDEFGRLSLRHVAGGAAGHRHRHPPRRLDAAAGDRLPRHAHGACEHEVETEVDRYISWPAQALSYKLGEIEDPRTARACRKATRPEIRYSQVPRCGARISARCRCRCSSSTSGRSSLNRRRRRQVRKAGFSDVGWASAHQRRKSKNRWAEAHPTRRRRVPSACRFCACMDYALPHRARRDRLRFDLWRRVGFSPPMPQMEKSVG